MDLLVDTVDPGRGEHVMDLGVRELDHQVGQELPSRLADLRVLEGPAHGLLLVAHALLRILPHRLGLPRFEVDPGVVEQGGLAEGHSEVMDVQEGLGAVLVASLVLNHAVGQAEEALVVGLAVAVLQEDGQELEGVALGAGGSAHALVHPVQLRPRPALLARDGDLLPGELALDARDLELRHVHLPLTAPEPGLDRAVAAGHLHRVHPLGRW